jgi:hypothetical protein
VPGQLLGVAELVQAMGVVVVVTTGVPVVVLGPAVGIGAHARPTFGSSLLAT